jgi:hypothetical protein
LALALALALLFFGGESTLADPAPGTGQFTHFSRDADLGRAQVFNLAFDRAGTLWVAASDGLRSYDGYRWRRFGLPDGLPSLFVRAVLTARDGTLWVGTDRGVGTFKDGRFTPVADGGVLAGPSVRRIYEEPDGTLWFSSDSWPDGTIPAGLTSMKDGVWRRYRKADGLSADHQIGFFRDAKGRRYAMDLERVSLQLGESWVPLGFGALEKSQIWNIAEVPGLGLVFPVPGEGRIVFAQDGRVRSIASGSEFFMAGLATSRGEYLFVSRKAGTGRIVAATPDGLRVVSPDLAALNRVVEHMAEAPDGSVWLGGSALILRWNPAGEDWSRQDRLPPPAFNAASGAVVLAGRESSALAGAGRLDWVPGLSNPSFESPASVFWSLQPSQLLWDEGSLVFDCG